MVVFLFAARCTLGASLFFTPQSPKKSLIKIDEIKSNFPLTDNCNLLLGCSILVPEVFIL